MNLPLFHDPLKGRVTVDAPVRDPRIGRDGAFRRDARTRISPRAARPSTHAAKSTRQREVAKVAEDLQALIARTTPRP
ncbi:MULTISPECIES: hypothetical protein [Micrococcaceae]|uniref:Uncharacterized protein n=1 Tax=Paenarthrobacter aromaticivorans TaxID=2849150 RepID=A0ABS6IEK9_9MICC|nr:MULTISPECIES: hypothetical protein [Micrococcaceae]MBU8868852.1 hypothetical protein [Paenarthrobacter sp. MMS21-TAE1-1]